MLLLSIILPAAVLMLIPEIDKSKAITTYFGSISAISAAATATVAVLAYKNWLRNKTLHDAYESVKDYILAIDRCIEHLQELSILYTKVVPSPGLLVISDEEKEKILAEAKEKCLSTGETIREIKHRRDRIKFWGFEIKEPVNEYTEKLIRNASNASTVTTVLNTQINYYIKTNNFNEMGTTHKQFENFFRETFSCRENITKNGIKGIIDNV